MKKYKISKEQAKALYGSIVIWKDRADGVMNISPCPLCVIQFHSNKDSIGCGDCIIFQESEGCTGTEFYKYKEADIRNDLDAMQKYATLMYNRLIRLESKSEICPL